MTLPNPLTGTGPASPHDGQSTGFDIPFTKFLCTIGPSTENEDTLRQLVEHGVTNFRLNFSHGTLDDAKKRLDLIRKVEESIYVPLCVLGDLPGPKIRCGTCPEGGIMLERGQEVIIDADATECTDGGTPVLSPSYENVVTEPEPGHRVLINDGAIRMLARERRGRELVCSVTRGGLVTTRKGINLPDTDLTIPAVTETDLRAVEWSVEHGVDFIALSFVRTAEDLRLLNARLRNLCTGDACGTGLSDRLTTPALPVIAKIETPQGVANIAEILSECDGIMVARGDLGVELELEQVPMVQKKLIDAAHSRGKPAIVATQMLESMINNAMATRAEVSDVANAILDDADCLMLSGETAVGKYPVEAVETLRKTASATERAVDREHVEPTPPESLRRERRLVPALAHGAWHIAQDVGAELIVIWSQFGGEARYLSRHSYRVPIVAFSSDIRAVRRMGILNAVFPVLTDDVPRHRSDFAAMADRLTVRMGWARPGAPMLLLGGKPLDAPGAMNTLAVRYCSEIVEAEHLQYVDHGHEGLPT